MVLLKWTSASAPIPIPLSFFVSLGFCSAKPVRIQTPMLICLYVSASGSVGAGGTSGGTVAGAGGVSDAGGVTTAGAGAGGGGAACALPKPEYSEGSAVAAITRDRFAKLFPKVAFIFSPSQFQPSFSDVL